tara:strand:+ start:688 stop:1188 length:501 start_codon:yes stop_codon:yes gene_type:complete
MKNIKYFLSYTLTCFLLISCTTVLDGVYTWNTFIQERSSDGDTFFAEASSPNGIISYGSSNDSQEAANNMASRHCSENSGKICEITRTITLSKKQDIESLVCTEKYSRELKNDKLGSLITQWCNKLTSISSEKNKKIAECSLNHISRSKNITNAVSGSKLCEAKFN